MSFRRSTTPDSASSSPIGQLQRRDSCAEEVLELVERPLERRAFAVELVDEERARDAALLGELPRDFGLHFDAFDRRHDEEREIGRVERRGHVADEVRVARRVEQVDLVAVGGERGERERHRDAPALLLGIEVADRGAVLDLAEPVDGAGGEDEGLGERGLTGAAVPHQGDVADLGRREGLHPNPQERKHPALGKPESRNGVAGRTRAPGTLVRALAIASTGTVHRTVPQDRPAGNRRTTAGDVMLDRRWRGGVERGLGPVGDRLRRLGISPDALTVFGLIASAGAAVLIGSGHHGWAVVAVIVAGVSDLLDGAIARGSGQASPRGAFFDSVADRASDALLLGGCAWWLAGESPHLAVLAFAVGALSMIISYERARAEALGIDARGGLMERAERFVFLSIGAGVRHLGAGAVGHARAHRVHRRGSLPARLPAGRPAAAAAHDHPAERRRERRRDERCRNERREHRTQARAQAVVGPRVASTAAPVAGTAPPDAAGVRSAPVACASESLR